jgi:hypothetical protein
MQPQTGTVTPVPTFDARGAYDQSFGGRAGLDQLAIDRAVPPDQQAAPDLTPAERFSNVYGPFGPGPENIRPSVPGALSAAERAVLPPDTGYPQVTLAPPSDDTQIVDRTGKGDLQLAAPAQGGEGRAIAAGGPYDYPQTVDRTGKGDFQPSVPGAVLDQMGRTIAPIETAPLPGLGMPWGQGLQRPTGPEIQTVDRTGKGDLQQAPVAPTEVPPSVVDVDRPSVLDQMGRTIAPVENAPLAGLGMPWGQGQQWPTGPEFQTVDRTGKGDLRTTEPSVLDQMGRTIPPVESAPLLPLGMPWGQGQSTGRPTETGKGDRQPLSTTPDANEQERMRLAEEATRGTQPTEFAPTLPQFPGIRGTTPPPDFVPPLPPSRPESAQPPLMQPPGSYEITPQPPSNAPPMEVTPPPSPDEEFVPLPPERPAIPPQVSPPVERQRERISAPTPSERAARVPSVERAVRAPGPSVGRAARAAPQQQPFVYQPSGVYVPGHAGSFPWQAGLTQRLEQEMWNNWLRRGGRGGGGGGRGGGRGRQEGGAVPGLGNIEDVGWSRGEQNPPAPQGPRPLPVIPMGGMGMGGLGMGMGMPGRPCAQGGYITEPGYYQRGGLGIPQMNTMASQAHYSAMNLRPAIGRLPGMHLMSSSAIPGRTDRIPMRARSGSFVLPADVVSGLGQGNTNAGASMWAKAISSAVGPPGVGTMGMRRGSIPRAPMPRLGGMMGRTRQGFAEGGTPGLGHNMGPPLEDEYVPIITAGGEVLIDPEIVAALGNGSELMGKHKLAESVLKVRKQVIDELRKLPRPVR